EQGAEPGARLPAPRHREDLARRAGRLLLRRGDQRLRGDGQLQGAGQPGRPLADHRLHPRAAVRRGGPAGTRPGPDAGAAVSGLPASPGPPPAPPPPVARAQQWALAAGAVGLLGWAACALLLPPRDLFFRAYLWAFMLALGVTLGSLVV